MVTLKSTKAEIYAELVKADKLIEQMRLEVSIAKANAKVVRTSVQAAPVSNIVGAPFLKGGILMQKHRIGFNQFAIRPVTQGATA